jgi:hypothetical protein
LLQEKFQQSTAQLNQALAVVHINAGGNAGKVFVKTNHAKESASFGHLHVFHTSNIHLQASKSKLAHYRKGYSSSYWKPAWLNRRRHLLPQLEMRSCASASW